MPIVTMPLCSLGANGTIARRHTFYPKAGKTVLRQRVQPSNPGTSPQAAMRGVHALTTHLIRWAAASLQTSDGHYMTDKERIEQVTPMACKTSRPTCAALSGSGPCFRQQTPPHGKLPRWHFPRPSPD